MIINHNVSALFAQRQLKFNSMSLESSTEKLSSGLRINHAGDDASGLAVSEKMRSQVRGLRQAERNAADMISLIQTSEGYLQEMQDVLHRIRELAVQAANGIYTNEDRQHIQVEVSSLVDEVNRIASHAQFNGMNLLTGRFGRDTGNNTVTGSLYVHIGANVDQRERIYIGTMTAQALGIQGRNGLAHTASFISLTTPELANVSLGAIDEGLRIIGKQRANLGAYQNRLDLARQGISIGAENIQASESQIRDADIAEVVIDFVRDQILSQSSTAMLAQANQQSQTVLQLLQ